MNTLDKILLICSIFILAFTVCMIVIFCIFQSVPDVLIENVFQLFTSEAFITFAIWWIKKRSTTKKETKQHGKTQEP